MRELPVTSKRMNMYETVSVLQYLAATDKKKNCTVLYSTVLQCCVFAVLSELWLSQAAALALPCQLVGCQLATYPLLAPLRACQQPPLPRCPSTHLESGAWLPRSPVLAGGTAAVAHTHGRPHQVTWTASRIGTDGGTK